MQGLDEGWEFRSKILTRHEIDPAGGSAIQFEKHRAFQCGKHSRSVGLLGGVADRDLPLADMR